ncbi:MAG: NTF2-like N-terminal transpeptidase domain-containing protein [Anaerolineales bacterium]
MKLLRWFNVIIILTFITACGNINVPTLQPVATATFLPPPNVNVTPAPDASAALTAYYDALKAEDYNAMYAMLSKATQDMAPLDAYAKYNRDALNTMSAGSFDYEILSSLVNPYSAEVAYRITYHTALVGDIQRDMVARFALENGQWKLQWDPSLILPELAGGNQLKMDYKTPSRGEIYDRNGDPLVAQSDAYTFSILPGNVTEESRGTLLTEVWRLCGIDPDVLNDEINNTPAQWPITLCEASKDEAERITSIAPSGLYWTDYNSRYYFGQGVGSNVVGYTLGISAEELDKYRRQGYAGDETVGKSGIEQWAEGYLAGKHGGTLYVFTPDMSQIVTRIAESEPQPADSVYLTLDRNLQYYAEQTLRGFTGAVVVMERDTGKVLAMASSPSFDSNAFQPNNPNSQNSNWRDIPASG